MRSPAAKSYDKLKYQTIYPQYIDSSLLPREGRRVTKVQGVADPRNDEIIAALREIGFSDSFVDRTKSLPCSQSQARQMPAPRGCVKVAIKAPSSQHYVKKSEFDKQTRDLVVDGFETKGSVMRCVADIIAANRGTRESLEPKRETAVATTAAAAATSVPNAPVSKQTAKKK